jgi:RNA-directed DNA polymerase
MVHGTEAHAHALRHDVEAALTTVGLSLNEEKTGVCHIDEGFEFLGFRIQRQHKRGSDKAFVYTWPSRKSLSSIMAKVKAITRQGTNNPLSDLLRQINGVLRGWTNYFCRGVWKDTFAFLHQFTWCAWCEGCATSIAVPTGGGCDGATWHTGGGPSTMAEHCSTVGQCR